MPQVGFEPTIPVFERAKTVHALDRAVTVIGSLLIYNLINFLITLFSVRFAPGSGQSATNPVL
jgi:hypothetical protein